jgi:hypothetical protein
MSKKLSVALSASRIKTAEQCTWTYWCKYKLKLPDKSNDGASRGTICHAIFECLGNPRHKNHYDLIIKNKDIFASKSVERMVDIFSKKLKVNDEENISLIKDMTLNGLLYDFFGEDNEHPADSFSEKDFLIEVDDGSKLYKIRGFIDKLFLYKKKSLALIRDFKSSKQVFKGKEVTDNMQDLMYCLAVKHLYPKFLKRKTEFVFLKFDLGSDLLGGLGKGLVAMEDISPEELDGFEHQLTEIQQFLENFDESTAVSNFAATQGYPKDGTFGGPLACGREGFKKRKKEYLLDSNGDKIPSFICSFRRPFSYWVLMNKDGSVIKSYYEEDKHLLDPNESKGEYVEKMEYGGCPHWESKTASVDFF